MRIDTHCAFKARQQLPSLSSIAARRVLTFTTNEPGTAWWLAA